jgi:hypothetical protein
MKAEKESEGEERYGEERLKEKWKEGKGKTAGG